MRYGWDRRRIVQLAIAAALIIALLIGAYAAGQWLENRSANPEARGDHRQRQVYDSVIEVDGVSYRMRKNLTTILFMGVDTNQETGGGGYRNGGQADFLRLMVIDSAQKRVYSVAIDRDTMTPITILGVLGNKSGVRTAQICLAHGFGDGKAQSCELTVEAVSNLLLGTRIDFYAAMNLDGISVLNDWAGGVTVTLEDDFSMLDPAMARGVTLTLAGKQAEYYARSRMNIGVGTNEARMKRQQEYIARLTVQLDDRIRREQSAMGEMYDALEPYLTTDLSRGRMINEIWLARDYERMTPVELAGVHQIGADGFMQMILDEASIQSAVLELFYEEVK